MIQCPECSKDIAEDAAHCGHCGAKIPAAGAGMKTMFGFGAISPEMMQQAADEVAAAKGAASKAASGVVDKVATLDPFDSQKTIPTKALNLPTPSAPAGLGETSSVFDLNAPGGSKPIDAFSPQVTDIENSSATVEPDSLGAPPAGSADPVWAEPTPPGAGSPSAPAPSAMPQSAPQNMGLAEPSAPKFDQNGTGGPTKQKSKLPLFLAGGCLLLIFFSFVGFILATFIIPML